MWLILTSRLNFQLQPERIPLSVLGHRFHPDVGMKGDLFGCLCGVANHVWPEDELHGIHDLFGSAPTSPS